MRSVIRFTTLSFLLLDYIGDEREFSKETVNSLLEKRQFFIQLRKAIPEIDLSIYKEEDIDAIDRDFQDLVIACSDKLEINNNHGFCQVLAYAAEMIQRYDKKD